MLMCFYQSPGYMDKVWELLKEVLPEFKLSEESISESKTIVIDSKVKEAGKEVKDGKEVKEGKEFRPEPSTTTLKLLEKSERFPKGKTFPITMLFGMGNVYKCFAIIAQLNDSLLSFLCIKCCRNN